MQTMGTPSSFLSTVKDSRLVTVYILSKVSSTRGFPEEQEENVDGGRRGRPEHDFHRGPGPPQGFLDLHKGSWPSTGVQNHHPCDWFPTTGLQPDRRNPSVTMTMVNTSVMSLLG